MGGNRDQEKIFTNINRLKLVYQVKLYSAAKMDWQPYFHELSLDSCQNNQLFLDHHQLLPDGQYSGIISGLALSKKGRVKEINLVGKNHSFSAELGCSSQVFGKREPELKNSSNCRWKCNFNLCVDQEKQNFDLIIRLNNNHTITYKKLEFSLIRLTDKLVEETCSYSIQFTKKIESIHNSRRLMNSNILQDKKYLFVTGNARSGTTALGKLLNSSPEICLGIERYSNHDNISAVSFQKESFFDPKSENYLIRPHFYEKIKSKYKMAKYIGDKRPRFIRSWQNTWLNLPQAKIIYTFRNIYDVAHSYNKRSRDAALGIDKEWSTKRDFAKAVNEWNEGLQKIKKMRNFYEVYLIKYEDFFINRPKVIHLFEYLEVDFKEENTQVGIEKIYNMACSLHNKPRILPDSEKEYIKKNSDFKSYNYLSSLYEKQYK